MSYDTQKDLVISAMFKQVSFDSAHDYLDLDSYEFSILFWACHSAMLCTFEHLNIKANTAFQDSAKLADYKNTQEEFNNLIKSYFFIE